MTIPFTTFAATILAAALFSYVPQGANAQSFGDAPPSGSFTFGGFGSPAVEDLPLASATGPATTPPLPPLAVTDLGVSGGSPAVISEETDRSVNRTAWTIGVYR